MSQAKIAGILFLILISYQASANTMYFELYDYVIVLNQTVSKDQFSENMLVLNEDELGFHIRPISHFYPPIGHEQYIQDDFALEFRNPSNTSPSQLVTWTPYQDGNVSVGMMQPYEVALITGEFIRDGNRRTPYYVLVPMNLNQTCWIYSYDTTRDRFVDFLSRIDIIPKNALSAPWKKMDLAT